MCPLIYFLGSSLVEAPRRMKKQRHQHRLLLLLHSRPWSMSRGETATIHSRQRTPPGIPPLPPPSRIPQVPALPRRVYQKQALESQTIWSDDVALLWWTGSRKRLSRRK